MKNRLKVLRAEREVILSGGTYNSPQLLMLSGIGPAAQIDLRRVGTIGPRRDHPCTRRLREQRRGVAGVGEHRAVVRAVGGDVEQAQAGHAAQDGGEGGQHLGALAFADVGDRLNHEWSITERSMRSGPLRSRCPPRGSGRPSMI